MRLQKIDINKVGRDFIIGDLHGEYNKLMQCMDNVSFDKDKDRLFSVGDLIDRGPHSKECLELLTNAWFYAVRGNHEQMLIDAVKSGNNSHWYVNGGVWSNSYDAIELLWFKELAESMPIAMQVGNIGIVHAEPPYDWDLIEEAQEENLIWSRAKITQGDKENIKNISRVYVGHTPVSKSVDLGNVQYIDTGAVYGGYLTMIELND